MASIPSTTRLFNNAAALSVLQLFNYAAPLVLLPYLTRILAVEEFGAVMVAMSTVAICYVVTDYGFGLAATYRIAKNRDDHTYINALLAKIFTAKLLLIAVASLLLLTISLMPAFSAYRHIFWAGVLAVVAQGYQAPWFFHGLQKMASYTQYMVLSKVMYVGLVLLLVNGPGEGARVLLCWSLASVAGALLSMIMIRRAGFKLGFSSVVDGVSQLREAAPFFWSRVAVAAYTTAGTVLVGGVGLQQSAMYSSAEQGYKAGQAVTTSVTQAMYPYMAREKNWRVFFGVMAVVFSCLLVGCSIVAYFAEFFVSLVFGDAFIDASEVLSVMMLTLLVNYLGVSLGYPALAALGRVEWANRTVVVAAAFFASIVALLFVNGGITAINIALATLATELLVLMTRFALFIRFYHAA
ncbi:MAG: oligosaccharide flippase family protein [Spongiibacteraceae bacterium]